EGQALVMEDPREEVAGILQDLGLATQVWHRRALGGRRASAWPPAGPFRTVALRLPRAREEFGMLAHAALGRLETAGRLVVYGANDEGAASVPRRLEPLVGAAAKVASGGRCRVFSASRPDRIPGLRPELEQWRRTVRLSVRGLEGIPWISYPGLFAHGRVDEGTALLLEHLPDPEPRGPVLDFACGSGLVGGALLARAPGSGPEVHFLDVDALAVRATHENVPEGRVHLGDGLGALPSELRFRAILSNPPYHLGKGQTLTVLEALVRRAPAFLHPGGELRLVVQRRLPVPELAGAHFSVLEPLADRGAYRVWRAEHS
ncbi:MAG TPA: methyltransferase, partial [Longimicrobiales bacterium]|nr:methyltransferase [Longimicrobiales bacterium]